MTTDLDTRMRRYEQIESGRRLMPLLPVMARMDGRCFKTFTRPLRRPYDMALSEAMTRTAEVLVRGMNACMAYTQSDEIAMCWHSEDYRSQLQFDGKIQKMNSLLAAITSVAFHRNCMDNDILAPIVRKMLLPPVFDARVWNVPNQAEGANVFLWRELDATRNSISMAASHNYSHKQLQNKSCKEMQEMLFEKGINWDAYPDFFKRGTFIQRRKVFRKLTKIELMKIPENHRHEADKLVERTSYLRLSMPPFSRVMNREAVIFNGAIPEILT